MTATDAEGSRRLYACVPPDLRLTSVVRRHKACGYHIIGG
jgi:hypothetical protein